MSPIDFSALVLAPAMVSFGQTVSYVPARGASFSFNGVFDEAYTELVVIDGEAVTVKMPVLGVRLSDMAQYPVQGDALSTFSLVSQTTNKYIVREVRPDSHGGAKLMLNTQACP